MTAPPREPLIDAIRHAINCHSAENASNTPDYILAQFLGACLAAFNTATQQRETWHGRDARPSAPAPSAERDALRAAENTELTAEARTANERHHVETERRVRAEAERDALRAVIERAANVMHGDGVMDQGQAWDECVRVLDAARAKVQP